MNPDVTPRTIPPHPFVVMLTASDGHYAVHSDHPSIPASRHPNQVELERTVLEAAKTLDDPIQFRWATGVTPTHVFSASDEAFLAADLPETTYKTVPGTERLPATSEVDRGDGISVQDDADPTDAVRNKHRGRSRVFVLGGVIRPDHMR